MDEWQMLASRTLLETYDIRWPKATGESPKLAVCVRWIDIFAPTPKYYRSHDDVVSKIQDASTKICMAAWVKGALNPLKSSLLDPKAWCLADGCQNLYDFDGLSENSTSVFAL